MRALVAVIGELSTRIGVLEEVVGEGFHRHPDAGIYLSQPGLGTILAARVLGEFGETRTATAAPGPARTTPRWPASARSA